MQPGAMDKKPVERLRRLPAQLGCFRPAKRPGAEDFVRLVETEEIKKSRG